MIFCAHAISSCASKCIFYLVLTVFFIFYEMGFLVMGPESRTQGGELFVLDPDMFILGIQNQNKKGENGVFHSNPTVGRLLLFSFWDRLESSSALSLAVADTYYSFQIN